MSILDFFGFGKRRERHASDSGIAESEDGAKRTRVLVVEDEPALREIYTTMLRHREYEVFSAGDGVEGLQIAIDKKPACILLDLVLPKKDGFSLLEDLKTNLSTQDIPVVILSNLGQSFEIERGLELGASGYLVKANTNNKEIERAIQNCLDGGAKREEG